jgi:hypothetical protein
VRVLGIGSNICTGYLFDSAQVPLDGELKPVRLDGRGGSLLLFHPIPPKERLTDISMLDEGIAAGKQAEAEGKYYHPAANAAFDRLSNGLSSLMQLKSIIANARIAQKLLGN